MNVLQVYETVLKSEIYQMYSTEEAQNSPQPRICPKREQKATLSPDELRQSERKYTSKVGEKYQLALCRRASQRPPRTQECLPTAAWHMVGDVPLGTPGCTQQPLWEQRGDICNGGCQWARLHRGSPGHPLSRSWRCSAAKGHGQRRC